MGLFGNIFGGDKDKQEEKALPWQRLNDKSQLETISKSSFSKPQIIFKHSTTCGISRMVMNMFKSNYKLEESEADLYYLEIQSYREVSSETGYFFQVIHESPQLLVIKDGVVVDHASHNGINNIELEQYI